MGGPKSTWHKIAVEDCGRLQINGASNSAESAGTSKTVSREDRQPHRCFAIRCNVNNIIAATSDEQCNNIFPLTTAHITLSFMNSLLK